MLSVLVLEVYLNDGRGGHLLSHKSTQQEQFRWFLMTGGVRFLLSPECLHLHLCGTSTTNFDSIVGRLSLLLIRRMFSVFCSFQVHIHSIVLGVYLLMIFYWNELNELNWISRVV